MIENLPDVTIKRAARGDTAAMGEIMLFYQKLVYNLAYSSFLNREDALDASQEVFIKIFRSLSGFQFDCAFSTWIYRVTKNTISDMKRYNKRRDSIHLEELTNEGQTASLSSDTDDLHLKFISGERKRMLYEAIESLPETHREIIILYHFCGLSYDEIAQNLEIEIGTVKSRMSRAKASLKKILSERNFF